MVNAFAPDRLSLPWQAASEKRSGLGLPCNYKDANAVLKPAAMPHETVTVDVYLKQRQLPPPGKELPSGSDFSAADLAAWQLAAIRLNACGRPPSGMSSFIVMLE